MLVIRWLVHSTTAYQGAMTCRSQRGGYCILPVSVITSSHEQSKVILAHLGGSEVQSQGSAGSEPPGDSENWATWVVDTSLLVSASLRAATLLPQSHTPLPCAQKDACPWVHKLPLESRMGSSGGPWQFPRVPCVGSGTSAWTSLSRGHCFSHFRFQNAK